MLRFGCSLRKYNRINIKQIVDRKTLPWCTVCKCVTETMKQLPCRHFLCGSCFSDLLSSLVCPEDKCCFKAENVKLIPVSEVSISTIKVKCRNSKYGCHYTGQFAHYVNFHEEDCIRCSTCKKPMGRTDMIKHKQESRCYPPTPAEKTVVVVEESLSNEINDIQSKLITITNQVNKDLAPSIRRMEQSHKQMSECILEVLQELKTAHSHSSATENRTPFKENRTPTTSFTKSPEPKESAV